MPITNKNIKYFVTTPRILKSLDNDVIEIDAPPNPVTLDKTPILLTIGPSVTMALVMLGSLCVTLINAIRGGQIVTVITSGVMAVGSLTGSVLWPYLLKKNQKKSIDEAENQRKESYIKYISNIENNLIQKKDRSIRILNNILCPSPDILCSMLKDEGYEVQHIKVKQLGVDRDNVTTIAVLVPPGTPYQVVDFICGNAHMKMRIFWIYD